MNEGSDVFFASVRQCAVAAVCIALYFLAQGAQGGVAILALEDSGCTLRDAVVDNTLTLTDRDELIVHNLEENAIMYDRVVSLELVLLGFDVPIALTEVDVVGFDNFKPILIGTPLLDVFMGLHVGTGAYQYTTDKQES